jgi:transcriptional regulator with XRE-family HTH domain
MVYYSQGGYYVLTGKREMLDKYRDDLEFRLEELILDFTEKIVQNMREQNISRAELARRLGVSRAFVTKLLNGNPNLTIKTMMSIADVLGCDLNLDIYPRGFTPRNFYFYENKVFKSRDFTEEVEPSVGEDIDACAA